MTTTGASRPETSHDASATAAPIRGGRRGYRGAILSPTDAGDLAYFEDGLLVVAADGTIEAVLPWPNTPVDALVVQDLRGTLIVPGFVDAHLHYPQTRVVGSATGHLLEWLEATVFPEEAKFASETYAREVGLEFATRCASAGTTTIAAYSSSHVRATEILFETLEGFGLRGLVGLTLMEQGCPADLSVRVDRATEGIRSLARKHHGADGGRLQLAITPRFALSCSRPLMESAARLSDELDLMIQTHIAEHPKEGQETLAAHPYASDYLGVYEAVGLIGPRTILAHAIHLSDSEWDRVAAKGTKIAHCPDSNAFLGSGHMRIAEARRRGVDVALGSDVAAGRSFDIRRAIAYAHDNALATGASVRPEELFRMATLGGAKALRLDRQTGALTKGRQADFVVLGLPSHAKGRDAALRAATFDSDGAPVRRTYVKGRLVWDGSPTVIAPSDTPGEKPVVAGGGASVASEDRRDARA